MKSIKTEPVNDSILFNWKITYSNRKRMIERIGYGFEKTEPVNHLHALN